MLDEQDLGDKLYQKAKNFNDREIPENNLEVERKNFWLEIATVIVETIKSNAELHVPGTGLVAPSGGGPVTGQSITGKIV